MFLHFLSHLSWFLVQPRSVFAFPFHPTWHIRCWTLPLSRPAPHLCSNFNFFVQVYLDWRSIYFPFPLSFAFDFFSSFSLLTFCSSYLVCICVLSYFSPPSNRKGILELSLFVVHRLIFLLICGRKQLINGNWCPSNCSRLNFTKLKTNEPRKWTFFLTGCGQSCWTHAYIQRIGSTWRKTKCTKIYKLKDVHSEKTDQSAKLKTQTNLSDELWSSEGPRTRANAQVGEMIEEQLFIKKQVQIEDIF